MMWSRFHKHSVCHLECKEENLALSVIIAQGSSDITLTCNLYNKDNVQCLLLSCINSRFYDRRKPCMLFKKNIHYL